MDESDRRREDQWFREHEQKLLEEARLAREKRAKERSAEEAEAERAKLKALHHMKCPKCGHDMVEEDLLGVKIDRCSFCEGVYLDAGELDQVFSKKAEDQRSVFRKLLRI